MRKSTASLRDSYLDAPRAGSCARRGIGRYSTKGDRRTGCAYSWTDTLIRFALAVGAARTGRIQQTQLEMKTLASSKSTPS